MEAVSETADVLVIGAGAAGLSCAKELQLAGKKVIVIEARDRIGGRVHTIRERGVVEAGAEFVHGENAVTWEILKGHNLPTQEWEYRSAAGGHRVFGKNGAIRPDSEELFTAMQKTEEGDYEGEPDISIAEFLKRQAVSDEALFFSKRHIGDYEGADADKVSAKLFSLEENLATNGSKNFWVTSGYDGVTKVLAEGLDIRLNTPVARIEWKEGSVRITCKDGTTLSAPRVAMTVPIGVLKAGDIEFLPALPSEFTAAVSAMGFGNSTKLTLWLDPAYKLPAFRMLDTEGLFAHFWPRTFGAETVLVGFSGGSRADTLTSMGEAAAIASGLDELAEGLGEDIKEHIVHARHFTWSDDPYARGSYTYSAVGMGDARDSLRAPIADTIYYTGEATNSHGNVATVHGAIEAGRDTARSILKATA